FCTLSIFLHSPLGVMLTRPPPSTTLLPYTTLFRSSYMTSDTLAGQLLETIPEHVAITRVASGYTWKLTEDCMIRTLNPPKERELDRKSTRLNSSHVKTSYAVFCLKKKLHPHVWQSL